MPMFYSKSTGGFYNTDLLRYTLPDDAVQITTSVYNALIAGQNTGAQKIQGDTNGVPQLVPIT